MVLQVRDDTEPVKAPVENDPDDEVVAMTVERLDAVPYAKPRTVGLALPISVILPFKVAELVVTDDAACDVRVGIAGAWGESWLESLTDNVELAQALYARAVTSWPCPSAVYETVYG